MFVSNFSVTLLACYRNLSRYILYGVMFVSVVLVSLPEDIYMYCKCTVVLMAV